MSVTVTQSYRSCNKNGQWWLTSRAGFCVISVYAICEQEQLDSPLQTYAVRISDGIHGDHTEAGS